MGKRKRVGNAAHHVGALVAVERAALNASEQLGEVEAVDVLHDKVCPVGIRLKVVDRDDVGVGEQACRTGLGESLRNGRGGAGSLGHGYERHPLDGHATLQTRVPARQHGAEAAGAVCAHEAVAPEHKLRFAQKNALVQSARRCGVSVQHGLPLCV